MSYKTSKPRKATSKLLTVLIKIDHWIGGQLQIVQINCAGSAPCRLVMGCYVWPSTTLEMTKIYDLQFLRSLSTFFGKTTRTYKSLHSLARATCFNFTYSCANYRHPLRPRIHTGNSRYLIFREDRCSTSLVKPRLVYNEVESLWTYFAVTLIIRRLFLPG